MRCMLGDGADSPEEFDTLVLRFLCDREGRMLMGIRRMGREAMVDHVYRLALDNGMDVSMYPDVSGSIVILRDWTDSDGSDIPADRDVVYGQDMCHQYPALGRMERPGTQGI